MSDLMKIIRKRTTNLNSNITNTRNIGTAMYSLYETAMNSYKSKQGNKVFAEMFIDKCNDFTFANKYYNECMSLLEQMNHKDTTPSNDIDKLTNVFIENVLPKIKDIKSFIFLQEKYDIGEERKERIISTCKLYEASDRVLNNHAKICNRFNLNNFINENSHMDIEDLIIESCKLIDTYTMPFKKKFNVALENVLYLLESNCIKFNHSDLVKYVTEYFLHRDELFEGDIDSITDILEHNVFINESDLDLVQYMLRNSDELDELMKGEGKVTDDTISDYFNLDKETFTVDDINFYTEVAKIKKSNIFIDRAIISRVTSFFSKFKSNKSIKEMYIEEGLFNKNKNDSSLHSIISKNPNIKKDINKNGYKLLEDSDNNMISAALQFKQMLWQNGIMCSLLTISSDTNNPMHTFSIYNTDGKTPVYHAVLCKKDSDKNKVYSYCIYDSQGGFTNKIDPKMCIEFKSATKEFAISESKEDNEVKKLINSYKKEQKKSPEGLKGLIKKIYTKSPSNIINETPNILSWIRTFFVFGTFAINPILAIIVIMTDNFIKMNLNRDEANKVLNFYKLEKKKCETKLSKLNSDEAKERCKSYIKKLDESIDKIENYRDSLYSEKELDKINKIQEVANVSEYEKVTVSDYISNYQPQFIRKINNIYSKLPMLTKKYPNLYPKLDMLSRDELNNIKNFIYGDIDSNGLITILLAVFPVDDATELAGMHNNIVLLCKDIESLVDDDITITFNETESSHYINATHMIPLILSDDEEKTCESSISLYDKNLCSTLLYLSECVENLESLYPTSLMNDLKGTIDWITPDNLTLATQLASINSEIINPEELSSYLKESKLVIDNYTIGSIINESVAILSKPNNIKIPSINKIALECALMKDLQIGLEEAVNLNSLKLAGEALKKKIQNLSTKEQEVSRNVDVSLSQFKKGIEKSLTTDKRESIIRGSIIPSFSKMMKVGLVAGAGFLVNPVAAAITAIGALAVSKHLTEKERKLLLDEIDIELKVVDKEIQNAETKGNMKDYRYLLKHQRSLEREKQRIKYNLKVYGQEVPDGDGKGDD